VTQLLPEEFPSWISFATWQLEVGEEDGNAHYQGYLECMGVKSMVQLHQVAGFERAHFEVRRGSQQQAIAYANKADTRIDGPWSHGEPKEQGKRSDLIDIKRQVDEGVSLVQIWEANFGSMVRYHRSVKEYKRIRVAKRSWLTSFTIVVGPSGIGKSYSTRQRYPLAYWKPHGKWFDDYDGEEVVVFDEFRGEYPYRELLRLLDSTPLLVESKGSHVQFVAKHVVFTSNFHPRDWYRRDVTKHPWESSPLKRRLDEFGSYDELGPPEELHPGSNGVSDALNQPELYQ